MDFLRKNLGPNKVSVNITPGAFFEDTAFESIFTTANGFQDIEDVIEMFRSFKTGNQCRFPDNVSNSSKSSSSSSHSQKRNNVRLTMFNEPKDEPINTDRLIKLTGGCKTEHKHAAQSSQIDDTLVYCIYMTIDPMLSLFKAEDINAKIEKFKADLVKILSNENQMFKKLALNKLFTEDEIIKSIKMFHFDSKDRIPLLTYLSRLSGKSLAIELLDGTIHFIDSVCGQDGLHIKETTRGRYEFVDALSKDDLEIFVMKTKISNYLKDNLLDKIEKLLVKDLKVICDDLGLPTSKVDESGKKKSLLKNELKDNILTKIELHKV